MKLNSDFCKCFAGLSCRVRIEIVNLLKTKGRMKATEIAKEFKLRQPTISHHLKYLENAGILSSKKEGRKIYYTINSRCKCFPSLLS